MKKIVALILCVLAVCASVSALATVDFKWSGSDIVLFRSWFSGYVTSEGDDWSIYWDVEGTNIQSNRRAVVRVHDGYDAASSTYLYSTRSEADHDYNPGNGNGNTTVQLRGRLDNRDGAQAPLNVDGIFFE